MTSTANEVQGRLRPNTIFYERRKLNVDFSSEDRRTYQRRNRDELVSSEQRRFAWELRRNEREVFKISVRLQIDNRDLSGYTHNISPEGLLLFSTAPLDVSTALALTFTFGENVCYLNLAGRVVFCRTTEKAEGLLQAIGIIFSAARDFEQIILTSAVHELRRNKLLQQKSLLNIKISRDTLAQELASIATREPRELSNNFRQFLSAAIEKRSSTRLATNFPVDLAESNIGGHTVNLSETGILFQSKLSELPENVLLKLHLVSDGPEKVMQLPAKIRWRRVDVGDGSHFAANFSRLSENDASEIREFIFQCYAKQASSFLKKNSDFKKNVYDFFYKDVRQYHESLLALSLEIDNKTTVSNEAEERLKSLTNKLLLKGNTLENLDDASLKKVKQVFREVLGCWVHKSHISKTALDRPRGYPGDYGLFEIIYRNQPLSEGIGFYWDKYFLTNAYTMAVRSRKDKMKEVLREFIRKRDSEYIRILNIACGGCREIRELCSDPFSFGEKKLIFTGLDHDEGALEFSRSCFEQLSSSVESRFLKENVLNLIRDPNYYNNIGKQDLIYILGLSEYLPDRIFKKLVHLLFGLLNDKGLLVITYKDKNIRFPGLPPDWFCDWTFVKRSEDDLVNVAKELGEGNYSMKIEREGTGCIFFLMLTKV